VKGGVKEEVEAMAVAVLATVMQADSSAMEGGEVRAEDWAAMEGGMEESVGLEI